MQHGGDSTQVGHGGDLRRSPEARVAESLESRRGSGSVLAPGSELPNTLEAVGCTLARANGARAPGLVAGPVLPMRGLGRALAGEGRARQGKSNKGYGPVCHSDRVPFTAIGRHDSEVEPPDSEVYEAR